MNRYDALLVNTSSAIEYSLNISFYRRVLIQDFNLIIAIIPLNLNQCLFYFIYDVVCYYHQVMPMNSMGFILSTLVSWFRYEPNHLTSSLRDSVEKLSTSGTEQSI